MTDIEAARRQIAAAKTGRPEAPARRPLSLSDVVAMMRAEGPLVHEPTGLPTLDDATMGGPVYGSRWYVLGAPDGCKTALVVQIGHTYATRGIEVGLIAVDEEPIDQTTRVLQRLGFERIACERRDPGELDAMDRNVVGIPFVLYDADWTIESAAADLAARAKARGVRAMLAVDSLQTVPCDAEALAERELSEVQQVGLRVKAIRKVAQQYRLIAIATSETGRGAYRSIKRADRIDPLAAAKWSGAVEYSARVMLSVRALEEDVVECEIPKNKHGTRRYAAEGDAIYLRIDRARQTLRECEAPAAQADDDPEREAAADARRDKRTAEMEGRLVRALLSAKKPITSQAKWKALVTGSNDVKATAVTRLLENDRVIKGEDGVFRAMAEAAE